MFIAACYPDLSLIKNAGKRELDHDNGKYVRWIPCIDLIQVDEYVTISQVSESPLKVACK